MSEKNQSIYLFVLRTYKNHDYIHYKIEIKDFATGKEYLDYRDEKLIDATIIREDFIDYNGNLGIIHFRYFEVVE